MFYLVVFCSLVSVVVGLIVAAAPLVVDFIIRRIGGLKALVAWMAWYLSIVVAGVGAFFLLIIIITLFASGPWDNTYRLGSVTFSLLFILVGGGVFWMLGGLSRFSALEQSRPSIEEVARVRAAALRWRSQWSNAAAGAFLVLVVLSLTAGLPPWLALREPGGSWPQLLTAAAIGVVWAFADVLIPKSAWRRWRYYSERHQASPTPAPSEGALVGIFLGGLLALLIVGPFSFERLGSSPPPSANPVSSQKDPEATRAAFQTSLFKEQIPCAVKGNKFSDVKDCAVFGLRLGMTVDEVKRVVDGSGYFSDRAFFVKGCTDPDPRCVGFIYRSKDGLSISADFVAANDDESRLVVSKVVMRLDFGANPYFDPSSSRPTFVRLFGPPDQTTQDDDGWGDPVGGPFIRAYPYQGRFVVSLEKKPDPVDAIGYINRGNSYRNHGDHDSAISDYTQAIRIDPKNASAYDGRGDVYYNKSDYDRAIADYTEAIQIDPKSDTAYRSRGEAHAAKGDYDTAIENYTEAIRIDPKDASAYVDRGDAYRAKGDFDHAFGEYAAAILS
jgi:predicted TPR repeat methyltransferase